MTFDIFQTFLYFFLNGLMVGFLLHYGFIVVGVIARNALPMWSEN